MGFVFLAVIGSSSLSFGNLLTPGFCVFNSQLEYWFGADYSKTYFWAWKKGYALKPPSEIYKPLIPIAQAELGVREATGKNDGFRVEQYLVAVGLKKGDPYCAAFVSWVFKQAGYASPRTGWSPALFPMAKLVKTASPGNVFGIYFPSLNRIAHCGFVEHIKNDWITTIEANTNVTGSREGDGVYRRLRHKRMVYRYAEWRER